ncbi:unnamed protein product [Mytilus coruscus]|uniref:Uncharacterized protein n=1 Tax=Mytilus coruscus TaxID=42192 RepID=A0A6J8AHC3_MYTCO|nr:unnamed protein product [Mytilus coruscus]
MAEFDNADVFLLQDDENDVDINEVKKPRIIKGTANASDKAPKPFKRKSKSSATGKAAKSPRFEDFSLEKIAALRDKMGIYTIGKSIDTLTHLFRGFLNKCGKEPARNPKCEAVSKPSTQAEVIENPAAVSSYSPIFSLEANFNADSVQDFDLDYFDDSVHVPPSGVCAMANDSPAPADFDTSFDPALGEIPQLNTEEKNGSKVSYGLSKAVNAAMSVKSNQDSIKLIEEKYYRSNNCENLCVPRVNKEIWTALHRQAHTVDSKMQETQRYFVKGLTPIVQLVNLCCKNEPLDLDNTRHLLSDSICLLGHGFLSFTQRRRSALKLYLNDRFKPICNSDVPVDSSLFGSDCMKQMKELGDYTKIPIANPRFLGRGSRSNNNSTPSSHGRDQYQSLNSRDPVGRQGGQQFPSLRGRWRGFQTGNSGSQRGHNSQRGFYQNNQFRQ